MKIERVWIRNFHTFKADSPPISFVDEATGQARPMSVLVGSNGSGKTTIFDVIEVLLHWSYSSGYPTAFGPPAFLGIAVRVADKGMEELRSGLHLSLGDPNLRPSDCPDQPIARQINLPAFEPGGLLYFPHNRWITHSQRGGIEPPPDQSEWIFRFQPQDTWKGSLSQLWVWQNYLDLEEGQAGRKNLAPFVEIIEEILGHGQRIQIRQGRVLIHRPHLGDEVQPDELPAGEQQILTLFGELARRLRPGAVVLIDEVENSLHPALQRAVLYHLRNLSRKYDLQVILATHSMEIVSAVAPHEIVNLDDMVMEERRRQREGGA